MRMNEPRDHHRRPRSESPFQHRSGPVGRPGDSGTKKGSGSGSKGRFSLARLFARPSRTPAAAAIPTELGDYRLFEKLGEGGVGAVYRALDVKRESIRYPRFLDRRQSRIAGEGRQQSDQHHHSRGGVHGR